VYVVSGLVPSIGSGLSVSVTAGHAIIGADINIAAPFVIPSLTPLVTNWLWLQQNGTGTSTLTATPPANSVLLGTCLCGASTVTSVNTGRTSGRQQFVQPQNLVPGGLAAGLTSAGHPDGLDLSKWGATDAEGQIFFGVLPAGAIAGAGAVLASANTFTNQNTFSQVAAATAQHGVVNIGAGGFTGAANNFAGLSTGTLLAINSTAGFTGGLIEAEVGGVPRFYLDYQGTVILQGPGPGATAGTGLLSVGNAPFDGASAGHFVGSGSGTQIAGNAPTGYGGSLIDLQLAGLSRFSISAAGQNTNTIYDAAANATLTALKVQHTTSATPTNFIGVEVDLGLPNDLSTMTTAAMFYAQLASVAHGAEAGVLGFQIQKAGILVEGLKLQVNGSFVQVLVPGEFRHTGSTFGAFGATAVVQPTSTTDIRLALISLGLLATGGASPMNLNGGALTAGVTNLGATTITGTHTVTGNQIVQGLSTAQVTKTTTYTATLTDFTIFCDTTTAIFTVTLPTAASAPGKIYAIKRIDVSAHNLTIAAAGGDNIEGAGTAVISGGLASMWLQSNGVNTWWIVKS
jgi:hypothetical protein